MAFWAKTSKSSKWHYFEDEERSLCGKTTKIEPTSHRPDKNICITCQRLLDRTSTTQDSEIEYEKNHVPELPHEDLFIELKNLLSQYDIDIPDNYLQELAIFLQRVGHNNTRIPPEPLPAICTRCNASLTRFELCFQERKYHCASCGMILYAGEAHMNTR